jgi:site-specific recombinase XerD
MTAAPPTSAFGLRRDAALPWNPLNHMQDYLDQMIAEQRHRNHVLGVRTSLSHFATFVRAQGVEYPEQIERIHLVAFQGWVNNQKFAQSYQQTTLKRIRAWLNWMVAARYLTDNPWQGIRVPSMRKTPNPLSVDELDQLFEQHRRGAFQGQPFTYHRRELILVLFFGWGLRIHELAALDVTDMDVSKDFVRALNKGSGRKTLPYLDEMKKSFRRYDSWRARHSLPEEPALLINRTGNRMTISDIWTVVNDLGREAHITINPHRLRDTCATHLLDQDVEVERVAMILGHADIKQTLQYGRVNNHKVAESLDGAMTSRINGLIFGRTKDLVT